MLPHKNNLVSSLISGDKDVFQSLYFEYYRRLYHFSYDFVRDAEAAKDIVNETFAKLWEVRKSLDPNSSLEAFLITVCKNKSLNFLKHRKVILQYQELKSPDSSEIALWESLFSDNSFDNLDYELLRQKVDSAIRNLPDQCRTVFQLSRFKKKKYSEIAALLNISPKTVEAHMSLALKRLKEELKNFL